MASGTPRINSNVPASGPLPFFTIAQLQAKDDRYKALKASISPEIVRAIETTQFIYTQLELLEIPAVKNFMEKFKVLTDRIIDGDHRLTAEIKRELKAYNLVYFDYYAKGGHKLLTPGLDMISLPFKILEGLELSKEAYLSLGGDPSDIAELMAMAREWAGVRNREMRAETAALMSRMPAAGRGSFMGAEPAAGPARPAPARSFILPAGVRWNDRRDPRAKELSATQIAVAAMVNAHRNKYKLTPVEARAAAAELERIQKEQERRELEALERRHRGAPRKGGSRCSKKPYSLNTRKVARSPFRTMNTARKALNRYTRKQSIGFTATSSLKSMGIIPRASGCYELGAKYATS